MPCRSYDLAAVMLGAESAAYVAVGQPTARSHYDEFVTAAVDGLSGYGGTQLQASALDVRPAQAGGTIRRDACRAPGGGGRARVRAVPAPGAGRWRCHPRKIQGLSARSRQMLSDRSSADEELTV